MGKIGECGDPRNRSILIGRCPGSPPILIRSDQIASTRTLHFNLRHKHRFFLSSFQNIPWWLAGVVFFSTVIMDGGGGGVSSVESILIVLISQHLPSSSSS